MVTGAPTRPGTAGALLVVLLLSAANGCARRPELFLDDVRIPEEEADFAGAAPSCDAPVRTRSGWISGVPASDGEACEWRGIPYAAPPVGELRWRAPEPASEWPGVRNGARWGAQCMQAPGLLMRFLVPDPSGIRSEDCLYLNIWRPKRSGRLPVVVFLHGGGYGLTSANLPMYRPDRLAASAGLVVVLPNYRLGAFGFLALPELRAESAHRSTGSYGTLDQLAALRWVRDNIEGFGGDRDNVTLMGESAGGWSVAALLASPLAAGLFHRAVMMSGGPHVSDLASGFARGGALADRLGCRPDDLGCLRSADADEVVAAQEPTTFVRFTFGPHVEGHVLEQQPQEAFRSGRFNRVPLIAGTTRDEMQGTVGANDEPVADAGPEAYVDGLAALFGIDERAAREVASHYPSGAYRDRPYLAAGRAVTERAFTCPTFAMVDAIAAHSPEVWLYRFDFASHRRASDWGASHGLDVPFVFDGFDRSPYRFLYNDEHRARARPLVAELRVRLGAFARGGAPDAESAVPWPRFERARPRLLRLADGDRVLPVEVGERCAFWSSHPYSTRW